ncbi:MAG: tannase/feruloyl esterase family alpha/beta hydrolase [Gammaproteobacteria bacterium]|jgi:feruloyl esterase|nr:tannase/feruloyl esterase family alpha/beta hydrolase [Gammaproteobacteria bacterium]MDP6731262.1 tannase/feruloyl esterase family alpha/beta hydrolase [Gammaproteobacteria bacterium]
MLRLRNSVVSGVLLSFSLLLTTLISTQALAQRIDQAQAEACQALEQVRNLTITSAAIRDNSQANNPYCYVRGIISPAIHFHAQLPLPANWNGRFLQWGDGGKDGDLDFADHRVAEGYAVTNSNMGHDNGVEPGASFGFNNRQAEIDFGYRAVHLTVMAGKTLVDQYYDRSADYSYFEGCSQGGRQGLMEAQRFPGDFDGIVAGAPAFAYQALNAAGTWNLQRIFRDNLAGNLAVDSTGDGNADSLKLLDVLHEAVLGKCDVNDGIVDGIIDDPLSCDFDPTRDLSDLMCPAGSSSDTCFTAPQLQTVLDFYNGPRDDNGNQVYPGKALGSETQWARYYVPFTGNNMGPSKLVGVAGDHMNYLFYEEDPGVTIPNVRDYQYQARTDGPFPEFHWMDFDINDFYSGKGDLMMSITDATDPDLSQFLNARNGKLIVYHGWIDTLIVAEDTVDYFNDMVNTTFAGSLSAASDNARLFLAPGMGHCAGGPGPNSWDKLSPLVDWVENGVAPDSVTAVHRTNGEIDNERLVCSFPQQAVYSGPAGGQNDAANWIAENFSCR